MRRADDWNSRSILVAATLVAALIAAPVNAAAPAEALPSPQPLPSWDDIARRLMSQGRLDEANSLLDRRLHSHPNDVQARFLKGMIAVARKDNRGAIAIFRWILIDHPGATRVRLELARAFYLEHDYGNSLRQFQFAMAGNLPPQVLANIDHYIAAIRDAKSVSYSFDIAVAPDTNLNTGSSAREVSLFGLPFDLSDEARKRSGIGIALQAGGEWAPRIGNHARMRLGLSGQRREYSGAAFDDMTVAAYAGPRVVLDKWDLSLLGTAYKRWYGSKPYNQAAGARLEATYYLSARLGLGGALTAQRVSYRRAQARDGHLYSLSAATFYALTSLSAVNVKGGVSREQARIEPYSSWSGFLAAGYLRDLPMGFSGYIEPSVSIARYDEALLGFGRRRSDTIQSLLITLLNRHLVLARFTPRLSYTFVHQSSTIPLYRFTRNRVEIGLTTVF